MAEAAVVIPVYKVKESYLRECIESVQNQTLKDIEILLIDDGSPDGSGKICDEYAGKDGRIRVIHQGNRGVSAARNRGIEEALADWILFVDSDDRIGPDNCRSAVERAKRDGLEVLLWGSYKEYDGRLEDYIPYYDDIELFTEEQRQELQLKTMVGKLPFYKPPSASSATGATCSKLYRREFLIREGLRYDCGLKRAEDVNFNIRVYDAARRIGYLNEKFYYYRQVSDSAVYRYQENGLSVFTDALERLEDFLKEKNKGGLFWQVFYMRCIFFLLESIDIDYFHRDNPKPLRIRMDEMKKAMGQEPYRTALMELRPENMGSFARRLPVYLLRTKRALPVCVFFRVYRLLKGWARA